MEISGNLDRQHAEELICKYVLSICSELRFVLKAVTEIDAPKQCLLSFQALAALNIMVLSCSKCVRIAFEIIIGYQLENWIQGVPS